MSMRSAPWLVVTLRRESCDCVCAVGVSGMSSSSDMGEGIRTVLSWLRCRRCDGSFVYPLLGAEGTPSKPLDVVIPPAKPLFGYPSPFMPPVF